MSKSNVYIGLLHHPVYNKNMSVITTSITNLDLHDIARSSSTYGVARYFVIHPMESQQELARRILGYWTEGFGANYNRDRNQAFQVLRLVHELQEALAQVEEEWGVKPVLITTDARVYSNTISYRELKKKIGVGDRPYFVLFGTGWGIIKEVMEQADYILEPIYGPGEYNHLSVRSAVAIILDRLLGEDWYSSDKPTAIKLD
ncbi:MAG TPA: RNA methyltransferase [Candidatus Deferrimicrobium sp.]|nr:RNA methyltransferase [Candidatus Deferrimicrobium sp.]